MKKYTSLMVIIAAALLLELTTARCNLQYCKLHFADFILSQKPPYMVPAAMMQIEAIPLNQNQNGCDGARFTYSTEPLLYNPRGGKIPRYITLA